jgi:hypothetical protein
VLSKSPLRVQGSGFRVQATQLRFCQHGETLREHQRTADGRSACVVRRAFGSGHMTSSRIMLPDLTCRGCGCGAWPTTGAGPKPPDGSPQSQRSRCDARLEQRCALILL